MVGAKKRHVTVDCQLHNLVQETVLSSITVLFSPSPLLFCTAGSGLLLLFFLFYIHAVMP